MSERESGVDFLRCISFFLVILFHSYLQNGYTLYPQNGAAMYFAGALRWLSVSCIGLYLIQTGYLHYGKKIKPSYFYSAFRVYIGYIIVSVISVPVRHFLLDDKQTALEWIRRFFSFSACNYGWYVFMYIGLILISPFINTAVDNIKSKKLLTGLCICFVLFTGLPGLTSYIIVPDFWLKAYPLSYYLIGVLIKKYRPSIKKIYLLITVTVIPFILSVVTVLSTDDKFSSAEKWEFGSLPIVILSVAVFLLLYNVNINQKFAGVCRWLGAGSLEGYLISHLFDVWIYKQVPFFREPVHYPLTLLCITVPVFIACAVAGHYLNRLSVILFKKIISLKKLTANS